MTSAADRARSGDEASAGTSVAGAPIAASVRGPSDSVRCERKFALSSSDFHVALVHVRRHPLYFREVHPPRRVNSVYLDSLDFQSYLENRAGLPARDKLRFRWYGRVFGDALDIAVERKRRIGSVGAKRVDALGRVAFRRGERFPHEELRERVRELVEDPEIQLFVARAQPALLVSYQRRYFLSNCGRVRLTLDSSLEFSRLSRSTLPRDPLSASRAVIEIKYAPESEAVVREVSTSLPYRQSRLSKFVLGLRLTHL